MLRRRFARMHAGRSVPPEVRHDWRYYLRQLDTFVIVYRLPLEVAKELALEQTCAMRNQLNDIIGENPELN